MPGARSLYSNSAIYAIGSMAAKAIGLAMVPIYTRCLTPGDYGTVELIYSSTDLVAIVAAMGLAPAAMRFYFDYPGKQDRNEVISSGLIMMIAVGLLLVGLVSILKGQFSQAIFGHGGQGTLVELAAISAALELTVLVPLSYVQAEQRPLLYTGIALAKLLLGLAMNIWLIVYMRMGVMGVAWSAVANGAVGALIVLPLVLKSTGLRFSRQKAVQMLLYGLPLVPAQFGMFVLSFSDRFVLSHYGGVAQVGIYSLGCRFGTLITVLVSEPFLRAWLPRAFSVAGTDEHKVEYQRSFRQYAVIAAGAGLLLSILSKYAILVIAAPAFYGACAIVGIVTLAHTVRSFAFQLEIGILVSKRTSLRILTIGLSAALDVPLLFLLVPRYGAAGAAWAGVISFAFLSAASYAVSNRLMPVAYDLKALLIALATGAGLYTLSLLIDTGAGAASVAANCALVLCYPALLALCGIYRVRAAPSFAGLRDRADRGEETISR